MKMIDVLTKVANNEIKDQTVLEIHNPVGNGKVCTYTFDGKTKMFYNGSNWALDYCYKLDDKFLNFDVRLIPPKPKKYYLRLNRDNDFSYVNWDKRSSYEFSVSCDYFGYKTKFTQEEIDNNEFLKFVEKYGVKEEAKDETN